MRALDRESLAHFYAQLVLPDMDKLLEFSDSWVDFLKRLAAEKGGDQKWVSWQGAVKEDYVDVIGADWAARTKRKVTVLSIYAEEDEWMPRSRDLSTGRRFAALWQET